jgi:HPt (histidine-containing phosphotransfer) domain-containing protein
MILPEIAGVDTVAGLARIGGSQSRYLDLLAMFCRDAAAGSALLEKIPDESSLRSFTTLVHALKSALANIGADGLSQSAALLEQSGREADMPVIRDKLPLFREELAMLTKRIREITAAERAGNSETEVEPDIKEALAQLREALETKHFDALDVALARLQALPLRGNTRAAVSELADLILIADFGQAMDRLADILNCGATTDGSTGK